MYARCLKLSKEKKTHGLPHVFSTPLALCTAERPAWYISSVLPRPKKIGVRDFHSVFFSVIVVEAAAGKVKFPRDCFKHVVTSSDSKFNLFVWFAIHIFTRYG